MESYRQSYRSTNDENFGTTPSAPQYDVTQRKPSFVNLGFHSDFIPKPGLEPPTPPPTAQRTSNDAYGRQAGSVVGGLLLMINSGLHIGWGIWRTIFLGLWTLDPSIGLIYFTIMAWSVGAFIGGFVGSVLTPIFKKDTIYYSSATVMTVGNLLFIIWDENIEAIIVGRLLIGGAHGIAYVALITHAGENASRNMRGNVLSTVNCMLYLGIFISVVITGCVRVTWFGAPDTISGERIIAIVSILLALMSIACSIMKAIETVPFVLHKNDRDHAMFNLQYLRELSHETLELRDEMDELSSMVMQSNYKSRNIFTEGNARPLVLMIVMRLMVALTNNFLINAVAITFVSIMFYPYEYRYVPIVVVAPRFFMSVVQIFYAGFFGRKVQLIVSASLAGVIIMVIGILLNTLNITAFGQMNTTYGIVFGALFLTFQLTCSIGIDQMQDVYLSEAFTIAKKPWSISFVAGFEHLFHIFMIGMHYVDIENLAHLNAVIFVSGAVVIVFGITLVLTLPETRKMSLKQANESLLNYALNLDSPFE